MCLVHAWLSAGLVGVGFLRHDVDLGAIGFARYSCLFYLFLRLRLLLLYHLWMQNHHVLSHSSRLLAHPLSVCLSHHADFLLLVLLQKHLFLDTISVGWLSWAVCLNVLLVLVLDGLLTRKLRFYEVHLGTELGCLFQTSLVNRLRLLLPVLNPLPLLTFVLTSM